MADKQPIGEVTQLIERWLDLEANGLKISVEELCQESPDLIAEVRQELSSIRKMDELLESPGSPPLTALGSRTGEAICENSYLLETLLGHGGCSEVYLAQDTKLGRPVAIKFLRPDTVNVARLQQRLRQEAEITSQLNHPGIVAIHASGEVNGVPFYSMQYVEGESLSQVLRACHESHSEKSNFLSLSMRKLLKHFVDVCQTIAFAHERNIIHRDLKPANIVTGQFGETYVIDWGLARSIDNEEIDGSHDRQTTIADSRLTQQGHTLGTPAFMSPEQVTGENIDKPSDIFNLGATLYAILVGQSPYHSDSVIENLKNAQTATFTQPCVANSKVPNGLSAICTKAMSAKPGDRYASAADLADDVEFFLADQPISAMPTPWSDTIRRWLYKHRTAVTTLATTALVGLVLLAIGNSMLLKSNRDLIKSEKKATANETRATANEKKALANEAKALKSEAKAQQRLYSQLIALANSEIENNNIVRAEEILEQCPPEYRQWEWRLLKNLVDQHQPLVSLEFPGDQIRDLVLDASGSRLAAGDSSGRIRIWDTESWKVLNDLDAGLGVRKIAMLPDEDKLIAGGTRRRRADGRLRLINLSTGEIEIKRNLKSTIVSAMAVSGDGQYVVTGELMPDQQSRIAIYDSHTLKQVHSWNEAHSDRISSLLIDNERDQIIASGVDGKITRWTFDGEQLLSFQANLESVLNIDCRANFVSSTGSDNVIQIWKSDIQDSKLTPFHAFAGHTDLVLASSISPDLNFVATAGMDRDLHIWDLRTKRLSETIKRHSSHIRCVKYHPTKPLLFSGGEDRVVNVWDTTRHRKLKPTGLYVGFAGADSQSMIVSNGQDISIWDAKNRKPILRITDHPGNISGIAVGHQIVASYYLRPGLARIWDVGTGKLLGEFGNRQLQDIYDACIFEKDQKLCLLRHRGIEFIDTRDKTVTELKTEGAPYRIAADSEKQIVAVGTRNGSLEIYKLNDHSRIGTIKISDAPITGVSISPDHDHVAATSADGSISVWEIDSRQLVCKTRSGSSWLNCLGFTPDGTRIVSGNEHTLTCWDALTGQEIVSITMARCVHKLAFNRDGTLMALASGPRDGEPRSTKPPDVEILRAPTSVD